MEGGAGLGRAVATREHVLPLDDFARASSLGSHLAALEGRSVVLFVRDMAKAAAALIDLDGWARRIMLCPPGWAPAQLGAVVREAEADALVHDDDEAPAIAMPLAAPCGLPLQPLEVRPRGEPRNRMDIAYLRHQRPAEARRAYAANLDGRDRARRVAAMGDVLRHPPLWRIADFSARARRPRFADPQ